MKTLAAVLAKPGMPLVLAEIEVPALQRGQALVELLYSGLCHAQLFEARGLEPSGSGLPRVLGHAGVGRVAAVGAGVTRVKAGDLVVLSWMEGRGLSAPAALYHWRGETVVSGPVATLIRDAVVSERHLFRLPEGKLPLAAAPLLGCAAASGFDLVFNVLRARAGDSLAVFGLTGESLCAIAAAKAAGLSRIVGVDPRRNRLEAARVMGASDVFDAGDGVPTELKALLPKGFDHAIEALGNDSARVQAFSCLRPGGQAAAVFKGRFGERLPDPAGKIAAPAEPRDADLDFLRNLKLVAEGRVDLTPLGRDIHPFSAVTTVLDELEAARTIRPLLEVRPSPQGR